MNRETSSGAPPMQPPANGRVVFDKSFIGAGTESDECRVRRGLSSVCLGLPALSRDLTEELMANNISVSEHENVLLPPPALPPPRLLSAYLRVRPALPSDDSGEESPVEVSSTTHVLMRAPKTSVTYKSVAPGNDKLLHRFGFTKVFDSGTTQQQVFSEVMVKHLNQLVSGQSCLLFTYGTTSSGKTYTVYGPPRNPGSDPGLLPRIMDTLFNTIDGRLYRRLDLQPTGFSEVCRAEPLLEQQAFNNKFSVLRAARQGGYEGGCAERDTTASTVSNASGDNSSQMSDVTRLGDLHERVREQTKLTLETQPNTRFSVWISFIEIYNESIFDLLSPVADGQKRQHLSLRLDKKANPYVKDVREIEVRSADEACLVLQTGQRNLHYAATRLNHNSSRSHCVVTIKLLRLLGSGSDPASARCSILTVCDLAGSERVEKSMARGARAKEAGNINTSLMVLGRCLKALRQLQQQSRGSAEIRGPSSLPVMGQAPASSTAVVPYRDSKLTRLFQAFFSGHAGRVTMLVNIGPDSRVFDETLQVLKFSALAKQVSVQAEPKRRERSRFSIMARASLRSAGAPGVPGVLPRPLFESTTLEQLAEQEQKQEELEERTRTNDCQYLLDLLEKLHSELYEVKREKEHMDKQIRKELTDEFEVYMKNVEKFYKDKIAETELFSQKSSENQIGELMAALEKYQERDTDNTEKDELLQAANERCCHLERQLEALQSQHVLNSEQLSQLRQTNTELKQSNTILGSDITVLRQKLTKYEEENSDLLMATRDQMIEQLNKQQAELRDSLKFKEAELRELQEIVREGGAECVQLEDRNVELVSELKFAKNTIDQLNEELADKNNQLADLDTICRSQSVRVVELEQQLSEQAERNEADKSLAMSNVTLTPSRPAPRRSTLSASKSISCSLPNDLNTTEQFEFAEQQIIQHEKTNSLIQGLRDQLREHQQRCAQLQADIDSCAQLRHEAVSEVQQLQLELKRSIQCRSDSEAAVQQLRNQLDSSSSEQLQLRMRCQVLEAQVAVVERERQAFDVIRTELESKKSDCKGFEADISSLREQLGRVKASEQSALAEQEHSGDRLCKLQLQYTELTQKLNEKDEDLRKLRETCSQQMLQHEQSLRRLNDELSRERQERSKIRDVIGRVTPQPAPPSSSVKAEIDMLRARCQQKDSLIDSLQQRLAAATSAGQLEVVSEADEASAETASVHFTGQEDEAVTPVALPGLRSTRSKSQTASKTPMTGRKTPSRSRRKAKRSAKVANSSDEYETDATLFSPEKSASGAAPCTSQSSVSKLATKRTLYKKRISQDLLEVTPDAPGSAKHFSPRRIVTRQLRSGKQRRH